jgi:hypothetical protein
MEIKLTDNSRLQFDWTKGDQLRVQLFQPGRDRYGHGLMLSGSVLLDGAELASLLATLQPPTPDQKGPN